MIVVIGQPVLREGTSGSAVGGLPGRIAVAAAALGRPVQLVGTAGEDEAGDAVLLDLAKAGVGHVAILRKAGERTAVLPAQEEEAEVDATTPAEMGPATAALDAGDVDLALRYLPDIGVLVLAENVAEDVVRVVSSAAGWADSLLVVIQAPGASLTGALPDDAIVFEAPESDDGAFASMVGAFVAALDEGEEPASAFRDSAASVGWSPAGPDRTDATESESAD